MMVGLSLGFLMVIVCMGLKGCSKSCDSLNEELESYISGAARYKNADKLREKCLKIAKQCPNLSSPNEFMGDLEIKGKRHEQGVKYYQQALNIAPNNKRIRGKIDSINAIIEEQKEKQAAQAMKKIAALPLSEYIKLDESVRLEWCDNCLSGMNARVKQVNQSSSYKAHMDMTPERLDFYLKDAAVSDPNLKTGDAVLSLVTKTLRLRLE